METGTKGKFKANPEGGFRLFAPKQEVEKLHIGEWCYSCH